MFNNIGQVWKFSDSDEYYVLLYKSDAKYSKCILVSRDGLKLVLANLNKHYAIEEWRLCDNPAFPVTFATCASYVRVTNSRIVEEVLEDRHNFDDHMIYLQKALHLVRDLRDTSMFCWKRQQLRALAWIEKQFVNEKTEIVKKKL